MAHLIDMSNNRANMAYVGKTPWHGLGQQINPDASIDEWRIAAGLDWHIQKRPIAYGVNVDGQIVPQTIADRFAHVRSDTQECLGIGSDKFKLMQPRDVLEFYRDLVDGSRFSIETAGALNNGARVWALARCNLDLTFGSRDVIKPYLLLATANDGSMSTVSDFTSVRVVCNNTLSLAVGSNGKQASIRVPHSRTFNADQVKSDLGLIDGHIETFANDAEKLIDAHISEKQVVEYFVNLYAKKDDSGEITNMRTLKPTVDKLVRNYRHGPGADLDTANGTLWGALNSVTNFIDFEMRAQSIDNRFASAQLGHGRDTKKRAFEMALDLAA